LQLLIPELYKANTIFNNKKQKTGTDKTINVPRFYLNAVFSNKSAGNKVRTFLMFAETNSPLNTWFSVFIRRVFRNNDLTLKPDVIGVGNGVIRLQSRYRLSAHARVCVCLREWVGRLVNECVYSTLG